VVGGRDALEFGFGGQLGDRRGRAGRTITSAKAAASKAIRGVRRLFIGLSSKLTANGEPGVMKPVPSK
jgi:hypothetical protein